MLPKPLTRLTLHDLCGLSRAELAWLWERTHGCPPPKGVRRGLLERSAAFDLQARRQRSLVKAVRSRLSAIEAQNRRGASAGTKGSVENTGAKSAGAVAAKKTRSLPPGTRLMREWNGRTYIVDVTTDGFVFDGKTYRSLSAIARHITGSHWSGPRFFGL